MADELNDRQKNAAAIMLMQRTLELYCKKNATTLEKALEDFSMTSVYNALYDFETGLWREGPEYILDLFQKEIQK